jgi:hypothetical protein
MLGRHTISVTRQRAAPQSGDDRAERTVWSDRKITSALFVGVLVIYVAVLRGKVEVEDTKVMLAVTKNLVNHGSLRTTGAGYSFAPFDKPWSPYGIADSILAVPAYLISLWIGHFGIVVSMVNPLLTASCVVLIYRIARTLNWKASHGLVAAIGFGVLSMALWYTVELLSEPGVTLCELMIVLGLLRWRQGSSTAPLLVGVAAALAAQFRPDSLVTVWVGLLAIPFFVPWSSLLARRTLMSLAGPMAVSLGFLAWYNELRYHTLDLLSSYRPHPGFGTPILHGLRGLLISPGSGLFVFNPLTMIGVVGLVVLFVGSSHVRDRPLGTLFVLLLVPRLIFFAKFNNWSGGSVWGPRYLLPMVALLSLSIVPVLRTVNRRRIAGVLAWLAVFVLGALGGLINYLSVRLPLGQWLGALYLPASRARLGIHGLQGDVRGYQSVNFGFTTSPIWGFITLIRHHMASPSGVWWQYGHGAVGYLLVVVGGACLFAAGYGTRRVRPASISDLGSPLAIDSNSAWIQDEMLVAEDNGFEMADPMPPAV